VLYVSIHPMTLIQRVNLACADFYKEQYLKHYGIASSDAFHLQGNG